MNRNLGNYDMVMGLSSNKINYQFKQMYNRKLIQKDWAFLTNSMGKEIENLSNDEVDDYWKNAATSKDQLAQKEAEKEAIESKMQAAIEQENWAEVGQYSAQNKALKAEVAKLKAIVEKLNIYDLGLSGKIKPPKIEILSDNPKELLFRIAFKSGKLFFSREGKKMEYDLGKNKIEYAFRVGIGKVKITSEKKIVELDEKGEQKELTLRDKGINDNDFTIQSLFLDFENANISSYDASYSKLPDDMGTNALLQAGLNNYFKGLAGTDNPYVLGYGIHKKEVKEGERALLYPTGVAYSTSHSKEKRASTFNFLMLLNNHAFPNGADAGVLPHSLMEYAEDKTATVNGVFGLNVKEFRENYVNLLTNEIKKKIVGNLGSKCKGASIASNKRDISINFAWNNINDGRMHITYQGIQAASDKQGINIVYKITAEAKVHQEIKALGISVDWGNLLSTDGYSQATVGVDWQCSTNGRARNSQGSSGQLSVLLKAGASGKLELEVKDNDKFKLGFDKEKPEFKGGAHGFFDEMWDSINDAVGEIIEACTGIETGLGDGLSNLKMLSDLGDALDIANLEKLENKVILPVSSVYTYKNVRIFGDDENENSVLLFDTSYGTVAQ